MTCTDLIRGSIYSRKGGNRYEPCHHKAIYHVVTTATGATYDVCGIHVRKFDFFNARCWDTDDLLSRPRRPAFYEITELAEAKT